MSSSYTFNAMGSTTVADLGPLNAVPRCKVCNVDGKMPDGDKTIIWNNHIPYVVSGMVGKTVAEKKATVPNTTQFVV